MNRTKGTPGSRKHNVPVRMCAVCRARRPKEELIRFGEGRGVYVCRDPECMEKWQKRMRRNEG